MALTAIKHRRSASTGVAPTTAQLQLGELALNTYDGALFFKTNVAGVDAMKHLKIGGAALETTDFVGGGWMTIEHYGDQTLTIQNPVQFWTGLQMDTTYTPPAGDQVQLLAQVAATTLYLPIQGVGTVAALQADNCILEMSKTINSNYTITSTMNGLTAGPVTVATGAAVTVPTGCAWSIV